MGRARDCPHSLPRRMRARVSRRNVSTPSSAARRTLVAQTPGWRTGGQLPCVGSTGAPEEAPEPRCADARAGGRRRRHGSGSPDGRAPLKLLPLPACLSCTCHARSVRPAHNALAKHTMPGFAASSRPLVAHNHWAVRRWLGSGRAGADAAAARHSRVIGGEGLGTFPVAKNCQRIHVRKFFIYLYSLGANGRAHRAKCMLVRAERRSRPAELHGCAGVPGGPGAAAQGEGRGTCAGRGDRYGAG